MLGVFSKRPILSAYPHIRYAVRVYEGARGYLAKYSADNIVIASVMFFKGFARWLRIFLDNFQIVDIAHNAMRYYVFLLVK